MKAIRPVKAASYCCDPDVKLKLSTLLSKIAKPKTKTKAAC